MRIVIRLTLAAAVAGLVALAACTSMFRTPNTHVPFPAERFGITFSPDQCREDLTELVRVCEEVHPNLYARTSREEGEALRVQLAARIDHPMTREEFFPLAARLAASFGDPHTSVSPPAEEWNRFLNDGGRVLPIGVMLRNDEIVISKCWSADASFQPGDVLRTVDGIEIEDLMHGALEERAGSRDWVLANFAGNLHLNLWLAGASAPFDCRVERPVEGLTPLDGVAGMTLTELRTAQSTPARNSNPNASSNWTLSWLPDGIAKIDFRSMSDPGAWDAFLKTTLRQIAERQSRGVIVDLRQNGGGDSRLGDALLSYVNDKPYRMSARKEWRSSERYRDYLKLRAPAWLRWLPLQYLHPMGWKIWGVKAGDMVVFETDVKAAKRSEPHFDGPVVFLFGSGTFSSAMMLANAVQDFDLARSFGAETGGTPNAFGEVYGFDLTHTGLQVGVSSAFYVRANGDGSDRRGVLPDVEIQASDADVRAGRDAVLEAARAWIASRDRGAIASSTD